MYMCLAAEAEKGTKDVARLHQQLQAARKALDEAEAVQSKEDPVSEPKPEAGNLSALRDKRRRLALELKIARDKVEVVWEKVLLVTV